MKMSGGISEPNRAGLRPGGSAGAQALDRHFGMRGISALADGIRARLR